MNNTDIRVERRGRYCSATIHIEKQYFVLLRYIPKDRPMLYNTDLDTKISEEI